VPPSSYDIYHENEATLKKQKKLDKILTAIKNDFKWRENDHE
jgi:hypothetical protein